MANIRQINGYDIEAANAITASYALTASLLLGSVTSASYALTASYVLNATSASYVLNATSASYALNSTTASKALTVNTVRLTTDASYYPTFVNSANAGAGDFEQLYTADSANKLSFNPSVGVLTATSFSGSLTGTASFATTASFVNTLNQNVSINGNLTITGT